MNAEQIYYLAFGLVAGLAILAAGWYYRFSHHYYRKKKRPKTRSRAIVLATLEVLGFVAAAALAAWLVTR
ncbi:MAG: hypothetical protein U0166_14125 [Acidobacteriota bacterium]